MDRSAQIASTFAGLAALASCTVLEPQPTTFFDRTIAPMLDTSCSRGPTGAGCHTVDAKGNAFGNLDLSTYPGVSLRRDLLVDYGAYLQPALLLKAIPPPQLSITAYDGQVTQLTHASESAAMSTSPTDLSGPAAGRGSETGAPATP